jgi:hypothetical protein
MLSLYTFRNAAPRRPLSSVVERVTRNDEVGCSIQPAGKFILLFLTNSYNISTWSPNVHHAS